MKGKTSRTSRLNGEYQKEISNIIRRLKDKQPDLKGLVSVTETDVAPDLKTAIVYVSIYAGSDEEKAVSFKILQECAGFIRHELSKVMQMRTVPALTFRMDGSMTYGAKMDELFKKLHENEAKNDEKKDEEEQ
jgi:ribosome-binding factor A